MSTEIKNTLFRFVTMRAPELLEKETVDINFVKHPFSNPDYTGEITSDFLEAISSIPAGKTKALVLSETATGFASPVTKREQLHTSGLVSKKFYDFAVWLTANRTKVKYAEVVSKIEFGGIDAIENEAHINTLWENLFYQIITSKSPYIRETILSLLVADFFINNYTMIPDTDEACQKLAQARVIIPKILFEKEDVSAKRALLKEAFDALPLDTKELDKELDLILCKDKIESYKSIVDELKKAQNNYNKANQKAYDLAKKEYEATLAVLYANAEKVTKTYTNPTINLERSVTEYVDLVVPPFEFQKNPELDGLSLTGKVSDKTTSLISGIVDVNGYDTFDEVINHYETQIAEGSQHVFNNTESNQTVISSNGVILPATTSSSIVTANVFAVAANYTSGTIPLNLMFSGEAVGLDIIAANYSLTFDDETEVIGTSFIDTTTNNKLSVKIFGTGVNLFNRDNMVLKGIFTLSDGRKIHFSGNLVLTESPFSVIPGKIIDGGVLTYFLRGKGTYEMKSIVIPDPLELPDDVENPTDNGAVIQYIPSGFGIKRLGIADYRKVEQEVCCYVPGEVSHIENIMASEYKEKATRRLRRTEDTTTSTKEQEIEKLTDSTSTDRFEMNQEISSVLAEDTHIGVNVSVEQKWTGGSINAGADFASNTSSEESNSQAVTHAKEVTERALDRVVQKVKEERVSKIIEEFEENSKHGYDNRKNTQHVSGVYRWVDKIYRNKVINYGKRLMYEFMIPEPAVFHNVAIASRKQDPGFELLTKPLDPRSPGDSQLRLDNTFNSKYSFWVSHYNVEITSKPEDFVHVGKAFSFTTGEINGGEFDEVASGSEDIRIPENYAAVGALATWYWSPEPGFGIAVLLGGNRMPLNAYAPLSPFKGIIPFSYSALGHHSGNGSVDIKCQLTNEAKLQWQLETFNAIMDAYEAELDKYNAKLEQLKAMQEEKVRTNPLFYRQIENMVLRKNCIEYLASHDTLGKESLLANGDIKDMHVNYDDPKLETYAAKVKFFEQAFEWNLMSYNFYPFYWADKKKWADLYNVSETDDPIFRAFLQSGMARVIVTARPGFEEAVNWYMATGQVWNGGQVPTMDDPLFVSIVEELRETEGEVEETWESRVPTSLTIIQAGSAGLEVVQALPCDEDCADYKLFDSDGQPVLDGNGNQISTNPFTHSNDVKLQGVDNVPDEGEQTPPIYNPGDEEPPVES
ncbi:hypothetical protein [Flavobacterium humi]|uniref:Uncharacterized protein n=1 Tax=Flavobacterium humi TaxID=2562683 RepID=A0A4Z0L841_9FLAO|nr:hypothetical protein [Flavobacterium humi]TGD58594.1 hypothetical protein E4635_06685 [Flavobacterium humi]